MEEGEGVLSRGAYVSTGKDLPTRSDIREVSCWYLSGDMERKFGSTLATLDEIWEEVTEPVGLSREETISLLNSCRMRGYIRGGLV